MTVQHQLEVYIELIVSFCASSAKKVVHVILSNLLRDVNTPIAAMNIIILKWVLTNFTLLAVAQPERAPTTLKYCKSNWAATKQILTWLETRPPFLTERWATPNYYFRVNLMV